MIPEPTWTPDNSEYHANRERWSSSMLKVFRSDPGLARWLYLEGRGGESSPSEAMLTGSVVNALVADPESRDREIYVVSVKSKDTKAYREAVRAFPERTVVTEPIFNRSRRIADAILEPRTPAARLANAFFTGNGYPEWANAWDDPTGVPCKQKLDRAMMVSGEPAIIELKTARDVSKKGLLRDIRRYGYDEQAAFNARGMRETVGEMPRFYFVFVKNSPPYSLLVYRLPEARLLGVESKVELELIDLAEALEDHEKFSFEEERMEDGYVPVLEG